MARAGTEAIAHDLLTTADAARILGLSPDMVRLLARDRRLPVAAETVRGVRLFRRDAVDALAAERAGERAPFHIVQFYEGHDFLSRVVAEFLAEGLRSRGPLLLVATPARLEAVLGRLAAGGGGLDSEGARESGSLTILDARETLESFMVQGSPDEQLFRRHLGRVVKGLTKTRARLRVYGEMVDLLCHEGRVDAAIRVEQLWNELARGCRLSRLCTYSMENFRAGTRSLAFEQICALHTRVVPTERYTDNPDLHERLRRVAILEQRSHALQSEMELRRRVESELSQMKAAMQLQALAPDGIGAAR
jgi:hypothetical protein